MSPLALIVGSVLVLALPWIALRPTGPQPEIHGLLRPLWWLDRLYTSAMHQLVVENEPPLPRFGPALLIANHTCGIDHLILQAGTPRVLGFIIAQEFYDHPIYHPFCKLIGCIPVKRDGRDQAALRAALRALKEGRVVQIFPEGRINPTSGREFLDPKPGAAFIALRAGVPVVPAYISGTPATNEIGKSLSTPSHARLVFGPPIDLSDLTGARSHADERAALEVASRRMMDALRALRDRSLGDGPMATIPAPLTQEAPLPVGAGQS